MNSTLSELTALLEAARVAETSGQWDEALSIYESGLEQFRTSGGEPMAELLRKIGLVHYYRGNFEVSFAMFERSKSIAQENALTGHVASANNCLAIVHQSLGQLEVAELMYQEALHQ